MVITSEEADRIDRSAPTAQVLLLRPMMPTSEFVQLGFAIADDLAGTRNQRGVAALDHVVELPLRVLPFRHEDLVLLRDLAV
jgi:hypothetical protein